MSLDLEEIFLLLASKNSFSVFNDRYYHSKEDQKVMAGVSNEELHDTFPGFKYIFIYMCVCVCVYIYIYIYIL